MDDPISPEPGATERRPRGRPRSQVSVVDSALALIKTLGVKNVTMEAIAEHAGVSKITLYRRWPSRAALLADALFQQIRDSLPFHDEGDPAEVIRGHVCRFAAELSGEIGALLREIIAEYLANPDMLPAFRDHYLGLRREIAVAVIRRGIAERRFAVSGDPELLHDSLYGAMFYRFLFCVGSLDQPDVLALVDTVLKPLPDTP
jgi:AcrR family transcriptional regulator